MDQIIKKAIELGLSNTAMIKISDILFSEQLRSTCEENTCRNYDTNWMCPPAIGTAEECIERVKKFEKGILVQLFVRMKNSFDIKAMQKGGEDISKMLLSLNKYMKENYEKDFLILGAGGCNICNACAYLDKKPCNFPDEAISSVEAHGIYVSNIMKKAGMPYNDGENTISYVGLICL